MLTTGYFLSTTFRFFIQIGILFLVSSPERSVDASSERDFNGFMVHFFLIISIFSEIYERKK